MARKDVILNFKMFGDTGADLSASRTSKVTSVGYTDNIGIIVSWTGTSPVGTLQIQVSNDYDPLGNLGAGTGTWQPLDFGAPIGIAGASGQHDLNINQLPFSFLRAVYTRISGVGSLQASLTTKQVGG